MNRLELNGKWSLKVVNSGELIEGQLPGCNYLDLMRSGKLDDPFWGTNETGASEIAKRDYDYSREFELYSELLNAEHVELVLSGVDTLAAIRVNGDLVAETDNIYRTYRINVNPFLKEGINTISIFFASPHEYIRQKQEQRGMVSVMGIKGTTWLRKTPCHFGWDWGPVLPPAGVLGGVWLESYDTGIEDVKIVQEHGQNSVTLRVAAVLRGASTGIAASCFLTSPDGAQSEHRLDIMGSNAIGVISVDSPELWWCNGLGEQPLYKLEIRLQTEDGRMVDSCEKTIGLRTIELDTSSDEWGRQFRFIINGVPIFAKGADWIPSDSFVTRTTREDLTFYIESANRANMNMLRVWGGGMYESDAFYELCDQHGILVWQDFIFACASYPVYDKDYLENVRHEVVDNVSRLRHHASLALWCGNNENELLAMLWKKDKQLYESNVDFYHRILRGWVDEIDGTTPYWPGSPSSGIAFGKANDTGAGDTHLWQIWHGLMPIEAFRKIPTRFCSEYGMESLPSMRTVRSFTDTPSPYLFDPVMLAHQKSSGGNQKMLFYLLAKYRNPASFEDFIYLSQLVQSDTVRFACEQWRRNIGRSNGALYWQYNDCWPVASWASIDYGKQYKALQYHARHFNRMLCISNDYYSNRAELHIINEHPHDFSGRLCWKFISFRGELISEGEAHAHVGQVSASKILSLRYSDILKGRKKNEAFLIVTAYDGDEVLDKKTYLLVPDKKAALPKPAITVECKADANKCSITLRSDVFARYVQIEIDGVAATLSDNFFDIPAGGSETVTVELPNGMDANALRHAIRLRSLGDIDPKNGMLKDKLLRLSMRFHKANFMSWIMFKFI